jgi:biotin carboxylase
MLLMSPATYRAAAFTNAACNLGIAPVTVVDMPEQLSEYWSESHGVDFRDVAAATRRVTALARDSSAAAVVAVDDSATEIAALVNQALGFPANSPEAAHAARDKFIMRSTLSSAGVRCPFFRVVPASGDPAEIANEVPMPCVVKPLQLSGSRGVIRANDAAEFVDAFNRLVRMLEADGYDRSTVQVLVEEYIPGGEVAVEGLLTDGTLRVLAMFDKPDPLVGPFFEETIYVTPSRLSDDVQAAIADEVNAAARALGLVNGPIHAELRVNSDGPWLLEVAGRSIGGLCSTVLSFGAGMGLEELILRHAVAMEIPSFERRGNAAGVMMIPIPRKGILREVGGIEDALRVPLITGVEITAKLNYPIVPLPEGASYLGFIFARGEDPGDVESAIRAAHERLRIRIDPALAMSHVPAER